MTHPATLQLVGPALLTLLTDEEAAAVGMSSRTPLGAPLPRARARGDAVGRVEAVRHTALLRLAERGLVGIHDASGDGTGERGGVAGGGAAEGENLAWEARGALGVIIKAKRSATLVALVEGGPARMALYRGAGRSGGHCFLGEQRDAGLHTIVYSVHETDGAVELITSVADPRGQARSDGPALLALEPGVGPALAAALARPGRGVVRIEARPLTSGEGDPAPPARLDIIIGADGVRIVAARVGAPQTAVTAMVNATGLRRCIRDLLVDCRVPGDPPPPGDAP